MTVTRKLRVLAVAALVAAAALLPQPGAVGAQSSAAGGVGRGKVKADYDPKMGVRIASPDGKVQLTAPVDALDEPATFSNETIEPPGSVGHGVRLSKGFKLEAASAADGRQLSRFAKPLRLVVGYDDADLAAVKGRATALRLFYQDAVGSWVMIPTTVDTAARTLSASVDHFTTFAVGTVQFSDDFQRPDSSTSLGTTTTGQSWQTDGSTWGICGAKACVFQPPGGGNYVRIDSGIPDQHVGVTVSARVPGATGQAGLLANVTADWSTNLDYVGIDPSGRVEVWTLVNGTWSSGPIAAANTSYTGGSAHFLEYGVSSGTVTVWVDGTQVLGPVTIPAPPLGATMAGLYVDATEPSANWATFDNFAVGPGP
ncbi:MAG TPA: hypothetical protein VFC93_14020 [Chloroflexota bacterium]|nr:hypothetical protein [Chloroflexota bacterium]